MPDNLSRERRLYLRLTRARCTLDYGTAPCGAVLGVTGAAKCYKTAHTCQSIADFDPEPFVMVFGQNVSGHPKTGTIFPALVGVSERPVEINLSGIDPRSTALGKRARVSATLRDFTYHDSLTDPYHEERRSGAAQADGLPRDPSLGTFFGKLDGRDPYFEGRRMDVVRCLPGDDPFTAPGAVYEVAEWAGPGAGDTVTVTGQDPINLLDGARSLFPPPSQGELPADLTAEATLLTLTPPGVGATYDSAGLVAVGREIMRYTRSGDVLTLTARGVEGTTVAAHRAGDAVQQVEIVTGRVSECLVAVLTARGGPIDPALIDAAAWDAAHDQWMAGTILRRVLWQPVSRATLAGELLQLGVGLFYDETVPSLRFFVSAPLLPGQTYPEFSDASGLIRDTVGVKRAHEGRISALYVHHGMTDPTADTQRAASYSGHVLATDPLSASATEWGSERVQQMFLPWFGRAGDSATVLLVAQRLVSRYRDAPHVLTADVDASRFSDVQPGQLVRAQTRKLQAADGRADPRVMQVNMRAPSGGRVGIRAESFTFEGRFAFLLDADEVDAADLDYDTAAPEHRAFGWYLLDGTVSDTFDDGTGPYVLF